VVRSRQCGFGGRHGGEVMWLSLGVDSAGWGVHSAQDQG
jgi:hypothetical protein